MAQISYTNKVALNENPEILDINKVTDDDMNEIKQVVNDNYNNTIQITDTEPTDSDNKLWIDTGEVGSQVSEITNEYSTSTGIGYSADYVNKNISGTILWTNPNPSNAISTKTITTEDMSNYDVIEVWFRQYRTTSNQHFTSKFIKGDEMTITYNSVGIYQGSLYYLIRSRTIGYVDSTTLNIVEGYQNNNGSITKDDNVAIPEYIVGYKTGLFS